MMPVYRNWPPRNNFMDELMQPLRWVNQIRQTISPHKAWKGTWPSTVTQFVVGAVGDTDLEILSTTENLHRHIRSGPGLLLSLQPYRKHPARKSRLPPHRSGRTVCIRHLTLLRDYGFTLEDLPFLGSGDLPVDNDPKTAWAQVHLTHHPIEINHASREELLRIPGIGPKSVKVILLHVGSAA